jgi:hypothetical protein
VFETQLKEVSERHPAKAGIEGWIEGCKMQVGVEMPVGLKISNQCLKEVWRRSELSEVFGTQ